MPSSGPSLVSVLCGVSLISRIASAPPGHLQPLGSWKPALGFIEVRENTLLSKKCHQTHFLTGEQSRKTLPTPEEFVKKYAPPGKAGKPVLFPVMLNSAENSTPERRATRGSSCLLPMGSRQGLAKQMPAWERWSTDEKLKKHYGDYDAVRCPRLPSTSYACPLPVLSIAIVAVALSPTTTR